MPGPAGGADVVLMSSLAVAASARAVISARPRLIAKKLASKRPSSVTIRLVPWPEISTASAEAGMLPMLSCRSVPSATSAPS